MNGTAYEFSVMSSPAIINPDKFVQKFPERPGLEMCQPPRSKRRAPAKRGLMCHDCIFGRHWMCTDPECSCVHREAVVEECA